MEKNHLPPPFYQIPGLNPAPATPSCTEESSAHVHKHSLSHTQAHMCVRACMHAAIWDFQITAPDLKEAKGLEAVGRGGGDCAAECV